MGRFLNADALISTGQGVLGNNMFVYCNNNPVVHEDVSGAICRVCLSADPKIDEQPWRDISPGAGGMYSKFVPQRQRIAVLYDSRHSGYLFGYIVTEKGFAQQGRELVDRLSRLHTVEELPYTTMGEFVTSWNSLSGHYDAIYIVGHGWPGGLSCAGESLGYIGCKYSYSDLRYVSVANIFLYCCNGATLDPYGKSTAIYLAELTRANVRGVKNGKLNFTWFGCYPELAGGMWVTITL